MRFNFKFLQTDFHTLLVALYLLLVPFGRLSNIPLAVTALLGLKLLICRTIDFKQDGYKYFSLVFLCFWIPILLSLPDAVNVVKTAKVAGVYTGYFLSGLYVINVFSVDSARHGKFLKICAFVILFWLLDALMQAALGYDFLGYRLSPSSLNGIFGEVNPKFGIFLAVLSPLVFIYVSRAWNTFVWWLPLVATALVVFLSGRRSGWIMLAVVFVLLVGWLLRGEKRVSLRCLGSVGCIICLCLVVTYLSFPAIAARVDRSLLILRGDRQSVDAVLGDRLPIWGVASRMIREHPVNGVGARGFRYAYKEFALKNDPFVDNDSLGAYQAHQLILDVTSNTGFIGMVGLIFASLILIKKWLGTCVEHKRIIVPYGIAIFAMLFPFNSHLAIYSSLWSSLLFWLLALYFSEPWISLKTR